MENGGAGGSRREEGAGGRVEGEQKGEISSEMCMLVSRFSTLSMYGYTTFSDNTELRGQKELQVGAP